MTENEYIKLGSALKTRAVEWDGNNIEEVRTLLGPFMKHRAQVISGNSWYVEQCYVHQPVMPNMPNKNTVQLVLRLDRRVLFGLPGDFIVQDFWGHVDLYSAPEFIRRFRPCYKEAKEEGQLQQLEEEVARLSGENSGLKQEQIVKEWAKLFNYGVSGFEYAPEIALHDFEAMVIYKFMSEAFKEKGFERKIATALYMAKHGLRKSSELPWK